MRLVVKNLDGYPIKYHYDILDKKTCVGEITYKIQGKYVIIGHLQIYPEYRHQGYGYAIVEYLLNKYPTKSILGETLATSRGFWHKCIKKFNGTRKNLYSCDNCTSSFVIPKRKISYDALWKYLDVAYEIN